MGSADGEMGCGCFQKVELGWVEGSDWSNEVGDWGSVVSLSAGIWQQKRVSKVVGMLGSFFFFFPSSGIGCVTA